MAPDKIGVTLMATDIRLDPIGEINKYDFRNDESYVFKARKGMDKEIVAEISEMKGEPAWMRDFRLKSLEIFDSKPVPRWGGDIQYQVRGYLLLPEADRSPGENLGRGAGGNQEHLRPAGHSRGGEEVPGRREGPV